MNERSIKIGKREGHRARPAAFPTEEAHGEVDLLELFFALLQHAKWIALGTVVCGALAAVYVLFLATPVYSATSKLYVMNPSDSAINLTDLQIGSYLTADYQEVFRTWEVHEGVIQSLGLDYGYSQLYGMVSVSNPTDTRILYITVKSTDPKEAMLLANAYADVARKYIGETMSTELPNILSTALEPSVPFSPQKTKTVAAGLLLGFLLSCCVIVVRFILDDTLKTPEDIQRYVGIPTMTIIPKSAANADAAGKHKLHLHLPIRKDAAS